MPQKFWVKSYPLGVPADIDTNAYVSLVDLFEETATRFAQQTAVSNFGSQLTYAALNSLSRDFAAWLQQKSGLKKGDRIAIMLPNTLQYYVAMIGALRAGLVVVNVNPLYTPAELAHQLSDAEVTTILVMANFAHTLETALPDTPIQQVIVTEIGDLFSFPKSFIFNVISSHVKKGVPAWHIPQAIRFKKIVSDGKRLPLQPVTLNHANMAFLQYTGGTTGVAKGAILTHGNIVANVQQAAAWIKSSGLEEGKEIVLVPLPLYHIFSLIGSAAVLITNPRDIPSLMRTLAKTPYTVLVGINTLFNALLQQTRFTQLPFSRLKLVVTGGMPLQKKVAEKWCQITGLSILEGYGLTEASPMVAVNPTNKTTFTGSIGLPIPSTDVVLRDDNNQDVLIGEFGELCVKGPQVMLGFWRSEKETQQAFTSDGWLKTGDIARFDADGFLYIVDRKKDMISVSGFKVYPNEVETVLVMHPGIKEAAVVGVPSEATGEAVKAFVVRSDSHLTASDVTSFCKKQLTGYKVPHQVAFVDELPKSSVGKVLRRQLQTLR
jgi:long-chain acyl-CoA synthetase